MRTVVTQRAGVHVGADAALGAQVARHHLGRVVRRMADLAEVRIRLVGRVTVVAVVSALAAVKVLVDARAGEPVEPSHRRGQRIDVHADRLAASSAKVSALTTTPDSSHLRGIRCPRLEVRRKGIGHDTADR